MTEHSKYNSDGSMPMPSAETLHPGNKMTAWLWRALWGCVRRVEFWSIWAMCWLLNRSKRKRSLWAGTPILTLPIKARGEELLGVEADTLVYQTFFITDDFKYNLSGWMRGRFVWRCCVMYVVFVWACVRYHRFHFFCDRGLLPPRFFDHELALLRALGKEIFFYVYGADVRTQDRTRALGEPNCCTECPSPGNACICDEQAGMDKYAMVSHYATAVFSMGDMIEYTPASRNDLFYWPIDLDRDDGARYAPVYPDPSSDAPVRVVHAPNHRGFKGSRYIIEAVERLRAEGLPIELVLLERVPNLEALAIYRTADIIFDQCLIGFHGYFALEALALGKPVMVFIRDAGRYLLAPDECPFIDSPPDRIDAILRELVANRARLRELGIKGRRYVEKYFSLQAFAHRLQRAYAELGVECGPTLRDEPVETVAETHEGSRTAA